MNKKNIILVGSTGSIGKNLTKFLAAHEGYNLTIIDRKSPDLKEIARTYDLSYKFVDLTNKNEIDEVFVSICESLNNDIYGLIFNAAQTTEGLMKQYNEIPRFDNFPMEVWDDGMQINVSSFFQICKIIAPKMFNSQTGKNHCCIINVWSSFSDTKFV